MNPLRAGSGTVSVLLMIILLMFDAATVSETLYGRDIKQAELKPDMGINAASRENRPAKKNSGERKEKSTTGLSDLLCPFKYLAYFFWYSFVAISASVLFVADLTTGGSLDIMKRYIPWVKSETRALKGFFSTGKC